MHEDHGVTHAGRVEMKLINMLTQSTIKTYLSFDQCTCMEDCISPWILWSFFHLVHVPFHTACEPQQLQAKIHMSKTFEWLLSTWWIRNTLTIVVSKLPASEVSFDSCDIRTNCTAPWPLCYSSICRAMTFSPLFHELQFEWWPLLLWPIHPLSAYLN